MPRRAGDFRGLTQPSRMRLLAAVQRQPGLRVSDLAEECGIPLNTVRDHLKVLEQEGLIRSSPLPVSSPGRPPSGYYPVGGDREVSESADRRVDGARRRGELLRAVGSLPDSPLDTASREQLDVLYEHLEDVGLEPEVDESTLVVDLSPCRYHALIDVDSALVCVVHERLVHDVLQQADGPLALTRLDPFVTEHSCRILLEWKAERPGLGPVRSTGSSPAETPSRRAEYT